MCKVFIEKNECNFVYNKSEFNLEKTENRNVRVAVCKIPAFNSADSAVCMLHIDENYNISLPMNGNMVIKMEPLPKSIYLLILCHPEGFLLKNIYDYRMELEYIYRKVSRRENPTVIRRLINEITNPLNSVLHKNLSIIRAAFLKKLPADIAQFFIPVRNRGREHYVLLDSSSIKLPDNLCFRKKN